MPGAVSINHDVDAASDRTIWRPAQQEDAFSLDVRTNSLLAYARSIKQATLVGPPLDIPVCPVRRVHDRRYLSRISHHGIDEKPASRSFRRRLYRRACQHADNTSRVLSRNLGGHCLFVPIGRIVIEAAIDAERPVLVALLGAYDHYTVICAYTDTRFALHDSYAYRWISKASCGVSHDGSMRRHQIATRSIIVLEFR